MPRPFAPWPASNRQPATREQDTLTTKRVRTRRPPVAAGLLFDVSTSASPPRNRPDLANRLETPPRWTSTQTAPLQWSSTRRVRNQRGAQPSLAWRVCQSDQGSDFFVFPGNPSRPGTRHCGRQHWMLRLLSPSAGRDKHMCRGEEWQASPQRSTDPAGWDWRVVVGLLQPTTPQSTRLGEQNAPTPVVVHSMSVCLTN